MSATFSPGSSRRLILRTTIRSEPGYANATLRNSNPARIGRGAGSGGPPSCGSEYTAGYVVIEAIGSVRYMAWSEMTLKLEGIRLVHERDRENAPVNHVKVPPEAAPTGVRKSDMA